MEIETINQSESIPETESIELQLDWTAGPLEGDESLRVGEVERIDSRRTLIGWNIAKKEMLPEVVL